MLDVWRTSQQSSAWRGLRAVCLDFCRCVCSRCRKALPDSPALLSAAACTKRPVAPVDLVLMYLAGFLQSGEKPVVAGGDHVISAKSRRRRKPVLEWLRLDTVPAGDGGDWPAA